MLSTNAGEDSFKNSELGVWRKDDLKRIDQSLKQKWCCSQIEEDFGEGDLGEGDVMDWYEEDEMVGGDQQRGGEAYKLKVRRGHRSF